MARGWRWPQAASDTKRRLLALTLPGCMSPIHKLLTLLLSGLSVFTCHTTLRAPAQEGGDVGGPLRPACPAASARGGGGGGHTPDPPPRLRPLPHLFPPALFPPSPPFLRAGVGQVRNSALFFHTKSLVRAPPPPPSGSSGSCCRATRRLRGRRPPCVAFTRHAAAVADADTSETWNPCRPYSNHT